MKSRKTKRCRGNSVFVGIGCGEITEIFKFGLCRKCYIENLLNTDAGKILIEKSKIKAKKEIKDTEKREIRQLKADVLKKSEIEAKLQTVINTIVRLIDYDLSCISCNHLPFTRQRQAGHYYSRGAHPELRFNFHNIHTQCSICNEMLSGNLSNYYDGLVLRYGQEYAEMVKNLKGTKANNFSKEEILIFIDRGKAILKRLESGEVFNRAELNNILFIEA